MTCDQTSRLVTAAEDRGDGDEPKANELYPGDLIAQLRCPRNFADWTHLGQITKRAADEIERLNALVSRLEETIRATSALSVPGNWKGRDDQWSDEIAAVHPVNSTDPLRHKRFETAMEMVGNRHGKYELVGLVQWLLTRCDKAEETSRAIADGYQVNHTSKWCRDQARLSAGPTGGEG